MMVILAEPGKRALHDLAVRYPGKIGWLMGPSTFQKPHPTTPYVLDNDAYTAWRDRVPWDEGKWRIMLDKAKSSGVDPLWCLVPDVVANRKKTIENWARFYGVVDQYGWNAAFAVQDGMSPMDVPLGAGVVFVGGTTEWKWRTLPLWTSSFPRVHVGRVRQGKLLVCERLGAESVDGSGWFRETPNGKPALYLKAWLEGHIKPHPEFSFT